MENDKKTGKNTLVVVFGRSFGKLEYLFSILIASMVPVIILLTGEKPNYSLFAIFILIPAIKSIKVVFDEESGRILNDQLGYTGKILLFYSFIFSVGWQFMI